VVLESVARVRAARENRVVGGDLVPTFCPLCVSRCGARAEVTDGAFLALLPDPSHPTGQAICVKGKAAPEIVYHPILTRGLHPRNGLEYPAAMPPADQPKPHSDTRTGLATANSNGVAEPEESCAAWPLGYGRSASPLSARSSGDPGVGRLLDHARCRTQISQFGVASGGDRGHQPAVHNGGSRAVATASDYDAA
jgi:hypothetical protein